MRLVCLVVVLVTTIGSFEAFLQKNCRSKSPLPLQLGYVKEYLAGRKQLEAGPSSSASTVRVGDYSIISVEEEDPTVSTRVDEIRLQDVKNGWGNGVHPTTKLCLEYISENVREGNVIVDYGTGSCILSILAAKLGASRCIAVDIEEESLASAATNVAINRVDDLVDVMHTREIYIGNDALEESDITIANILPGALNRLAPLLWLLTKPGGKICLSGLRPEQLPALQTIYAPYVNVDTQETIQENHKDFGQWVRWAVETKVLSVEEREQLMDELTQASVEA